MLIYKAIPSIIKDIEAVKKKKSEETYGSVKYAYRRIDDFMNALNPLLGKNEVTLVPEVLDVERGTVDTKSGGIMNTVKIKVRYSLYASDGSFVSGTVIGEGFDSGDKASGKAQSNALKYFIMPTFMVPTEDIDDTDGHEHEELSQKEKQALRSQPQKNTQINQSKPVTNHNDYIINLGDKNKMTGTRLQDHSLDYLQKCIDSTLKYHQDNNKALHKNTQEFVEKATQYLKMQDS